MSENVNSEFSTTDLGLFKQCLKLAEEALDAGDEPFGSILVDEDYNILAKTRNRVNEKNVLAHPEIELAKWALENLSIEQRRSAKMFTTGEHCPMCAAAHGWAEIGSLYYLSSAKQLGKWLTNFGAAPAPIEFLPVGKIIKHAIIKGPASGEMVEEIRAMHERYHDLKM